MFEFQALDTHFKAMDQKMPVFASIQSCLKYFYNMKNFGIFYYIMWKVISGKDNIFMEFFFFFDYEDLWKPLESILKTHMTTIVISGISC